MFNEAQTVPGKLLTWVWRLTYHCFAELMSQQPARRTFFRSCESASHHSIPFLNASRTYMGQLYLRTIFIAYGADATVPESTNGSFGGGPRIFPDLVPSNYACNLGSSGPPL